MKISVFILALIFTLASTGAVQAQYTLPQQLPGVYQNFNAMQAQNKYLQEQRNKQSNQPATDQALPPAQPDAEVLQETAPEQVIPAQAQEQTIQAQDQQPAEQQSNSLNWPWVVGLGLVIAVAVISLWVFKDKVLS